MRKWKGREGEVKQERDRRNYDIDLVEVGCVCVVGVFQYLRLLAPFFVMCDAYNADQPSQKRMF